jgi:hypothetical protein
LLSPKVFLESSAAAEVLTGAATEMGGALESANDGSAAQHTVVAEILGRLDPSAPYVKDYFAAINSCRIDISSSETKGVSVGGGGGGAVAAAAGGFMFKSGAGAVVAGTPASNAADSTRIARARAVLVTGARFTGTIDIPGALYLMRSFGVEVEVEVAAAVGGMFRGKKENWGLGGATSQSTVVRRQ